ncbi:MAG TPA: 4Fe-4S binding protein [Noviherbaspirillum sp.]|uniref:4Fe-4S binding protein n=1 Tax=Noviherbaspirillum sp. TaxID=1926288 RepID=UPI002D6D7076|nr:4Fe-4S binding protein [Noviherbaspirillum sp.]HYD94503.1 4Fe-4S binding protein [Noviherbaspirillum sp.]
MKNLLFAAMLLLAQTVTAPAYAHGGLEEVPAAAGKQHAPAKGAAPAQAPAAATDDPHHGHGNPASADPDAQSAHAGHAAPADDATDSGAEAHEEMTMLHPGLPGEWILPAALAMLAIALWSLCAKLPSEKEPRTANLATLPLVGPFVRFLNRSPYPLLAIKIVSVAVFIMVVVAGLFGTVYPEHNLATALVWNLWWPLVVVSVFFLGTAWCAICPWNTLSNWLIRRKLWKRANPHPGRNGKVPRWLQNVWLALLMFIGLTWLETGIGVTSKPFATALMALVMLGLSLLFQWLFERKAFCRYVCPVGRTLGYYARLAPVAVRPVDQKTCDSCKTLECYNGSKEIDPCPTHLVVGRFSQNTNCLSCGSCMQSCPHQNVSWQLRPMGSEAKDQARPQWDGAWFMLLLLGITIFHGLTMMPFWRDWIVAVAGFIGESGAPYMSFTLAMLGSFAAVGVVYAALVGVSWLAARRATSYRGLFTAFSFSALPLAFVYHLAHNLDHISRESADLFALLLNPLGIGLGPVSSMDKHNQMMSPIFPDELMYTLQAGLMVLGFWLAVQIVRNRGRGQLAGSRGAVALRLLPVLAFVGAITAFNLWLMAQGMEMRF